MSELKEAAEIAKAVAIVAEADQSRIETRHSQGWISQLAESPKRQLTWLKKLWKLAESTSIAYHGNIVDLLEYVNENNIHVDLLSDQTFATMSTTAATVRLASALKSGLASLAEDKETFAKLVDQNLGTSLQGNQDPD